MSKEKSEFGKGLVVCLVKFAEHMCMGNITEKLYDPKKSSHYLSEKKIEKYEIEVPEGKEWDVIRLEVKKLQDKGLEIGHGFTGKIWKKDDFYELFDLIRKIALMVDKKLGLKAEEGAH